MTTSRPALGVAMVLGSGALFAVNGTVSKLVLRAGLNAQQLTLLRALGAVTGLLLLSLVLRPGVRRLRTTPRQIPLLVAYGLTGFFLVPMLYFVAISRLPVGLGLLFEYSAPLLVALWARFGQRHRVRPRLWAGLALSLAGLGCVAEVWGELKLDGLGILAGLGAAVFLAVYYVLGARGVQGRDTLSLCTWAFGASAVAGLLTRAVTAGTGGWEPLTGSAAGVPVALLCGYVVVLGSIVPYLLVAGAMRHLPATSVGIVGMVEPVLAAAVAWVVIGDGETLNTAQLGGGALVLLGVALAETARVATPRASTPPAPDTVTLDPAPPARPLKGPGNERAGRGSGRPWELGGSGPGRIGVMQSHPNVRAMREALDAAGALDGAGRPSAVRLLPEAVHTAAAAAEALGVGVGAIANSLVFAADDAPLLVLTSGAHRVDTAGLAASLGVTHLRRATPEFVRQHTGQVIGGVAPLGHPAPLRTLVDTALEGYDEVWAAGGVPRAVFPTTYAELLRITAGTPAEVA